MNLGWLTSSTADHAEAGSSSHDPIFGTGSSLHEPHSSSHFENPREEYHILPAMSDLDHFTNDVLSIEQDILSQLKHELGSSFQQQQQQQQQQQPQPQHQLPQLHQQQQQQYWQTGAPLSDLSHHAFADLHSDFPFQQGGTTLAGSHFSGTGAQQISVPTVSVQTSSSAIAPTNQKPGKWIIDMTAEELAHEMQRRNITFPVTQVLQARTNCTAIYNEFCKHMDERNRRTMEDALATLRKFGPGAFHEQEVVVRLARLQEKIDRSKNRLRARLELCLSTYLDSLQQAAGTTSAPKTTKKQSKNRQLPDTAKNILRDWFLVHYDHPYPSETDKDALAKQTGLTKTQINNWFINQRVRIWRQVKRETSQMQKQP